MTQPHPWPQNQLVVGREFFGALIDDRGRGWPSDIPLGESPSHVTDGVNRIRVTRRGVLVGCEYFGTEEEVGRLLAAHGVGPEEPERTTLPANRESASGLA